MVRRRRGGAAVAWAGPLFAGADGRSRVAFLAVDGPGMVPDFFGPRRRLINRGNGAPRIVEALG